MTSILIVLALAALFAVFGLLMRGRQSVCDGTRCGESPSGSDGCSRSADATRCPLALLGSRPAQDSGPERRSSRASLAE